MKKLFFAALICLFAVSCDRFKSVEIPIDGTDLVAYTAKGTTFIGVKHPGVKTTLTEPLYVKVNHHNGYLICQIGMPSTGPVTWDLLDATEAKSVTGRTYDKVIYTSTFFILQSGDEQYFLSNGATDVIGPKQDFKSHGKLLFTKSGDKWGLNGVLNDQYDAITVIQQNGTDEYRLLVKLDDKYQLFDSEGNLLKKYVAPQAVKKLDTLSAKFADAMWDDKPISGRTVANLKTAI